MTKLESDIEELWDWICARIGFVQELVLTKKVLNYKTL